MSVQGLNQRLAVGQPALGRDKHPGAARTHPITDAYILWRLFKEALRRITGVPTDASLPIRLFAIGVLASVLRRIAAPARRIPAELAAFIRRYGV